MAGVCFLDVFVVKENRRNSDCQRTLQLRCRGKGAKENLDTAIVLFLGPERLSDEVF